MGLEGANVILCLNNQNIWTKPFTFNLMVIPLRFCNVNHSNIMENFEPQDQSLFVCTKLQNWIAVQVGHSTKNKILRGWGLGPENCRLSKKDFESLEKRWHKPATPFLWHFSFHKRGYCHTSHKEYFSTDFKSIFHSRSLRQNVPWWSGFLSCSAGHTGCWERERGGERAVKNDDGGKRRRGRGK